jgi:hypothetical protein
LVSPRVTASGSSSKTTSSAGPSAATRPSPKLAPGAASAARTKPGDVVRDRPRLIVAKPGIGEGGGEEGLAGADAERAAQQNCVSLGSTLAKIRRWSAYQPSPNSGSGCSRNA